MLNSVVTEWASMIFRWLHVIAAVGWIGSSFYFIHLDLSLKTRPGLPDGVSGDAWQVHGGGFYNIVKYPRRAGADAGRTDVVQMGSVRHLAVGLRAGGRRLLSRCRAVPGGQIGDGPHAAAGRPVQPRQSRARLAALRDRLPHRVRQARTAFVITGYIFLVALTYAFTHVLSGRGAFNQIGAIIGTIMVANVFLNIIPGHGRLLPR